MKTCKTMKNLILLSIAILTIQIANGQHLRPHQNYLDLNSGFGMLPTFIKDAGKVRTPPISFTADYKLAEHFSLGAFVGYSVTETDVRFLRDGSIAQWGNHFTVLGLRMAARSRQMGPWNVYGGLSAGYSISHIDIMKGDLEKVKQDRNLQEVSGKMLLTGFLGGRYSFTARTGFFAELGYGISLTTIGLSFRII